ncbi:MAG: hypothetical protein QNJ12_08670 [Ilumatobacter sp.]|uniref:hypothetical protein n=1 Tax=Ilumatobacter sp. TaxID=1967498 RepID=UPI00260AF6CD|nr:hypothetical protein [Ilumatobacter sp.]MDJ0768853.1 hypothetical protein [Ilumatobacter sp.]
MIRRSPARLALALTAAALALSGCSTLGADDVAARVGDAELSHDELKERSSKLGLPIDDAVVVADDARAITATWIATELIREVGLIDRYEAGGETSGIWCLSFFQVGNIDEAQAYVDRLDAGEDWHAILAAELPDLPNAARAQCQPTESLGESITQLTGMSPSDPHRTVATPDGLTLVVRMQPVDEVNGFELMSLAQATDPSLIDAVLELAMTADVSVDPQLGAFSPEDLSVVPLG